MDTVIHTYLTRLRIISKIPTNGKIDTTNNDLNIYYNTLSNWIMRKIQGDNKDNATKYLIDLYREINSFSDQLMSNVNTETDEIHKHKKIIMLTSLAEKIKESLTGIRNLIGTYKDYLKTVSLLECLEQDIIMPQYRVLQDFIPTTYHTEIMIGTMGTNQISAPTMSPVRSMASSSINSTDREHMSLYATSQPINIPTRHSQSK
jgi:hypothetical protein